MVPIFVGGDMMVKLAADAERVCRRCGVPLGLFSALIPALIYVIQPVLMQTQKQILAADVK